MSEHGTEVLIRTVRPADLDALRRMRQALWPDCDDAETDEVASRDPERYAVLVAERPGGELCGFAEVGTRTYASGCLTSPVGYLEGIWVDAVARRRAVGRSLVRRAEAWVEARGLTEMASDCLLGNEESADFHQAVGFDEVERIICFRKSLAPVGAGPRR